MYPRAAYATALIDGRPNDRPRLALAKTAPHIRHAAIEQMQAMCWVRYSRVQFDGLEWALDNEDDFDACLTAAALLRCVIEELAFTEPLDARASAEGGILGSGSINLELPESAFRPDRSSGQMLGRALPRRESKPADERTSDSTGVRFACPIPGCSKVFVGSRGGWDGHVGAVRQHPSWHAEIGDAETRRDLFRREFQTFFRG
jgi:hypothetical protein